jgi:tetratricopeptide (TPR) repeat protein
VVDRARCLDRLGRRREALRALDSHPRATFGSAAALVLRAELLSHLGRLSEARDDLLRANRLEPGRADYLVRLAEAHQMLGETEASGQAALSALTLSAVPEPAVSPEARLDLRLSAAAILAGLGWEPELVLGVCAEILAADVEPALRTQALSVRAYALLTLARPAETAAAVEESLALGENVELYLLGAAAASQLGDSQTRVTYLREGVRCLEEDPGADADELAVGGLIAAILGHFDRALALADRALAADPESEVALPVRAHCLLRLDRTEEALATTAARRAAELSSPLLVLTRAEALGRLGRHDESLAELAGPLPLDTGPLAPLLTQLQEVQPVERRDLLRGRALRHLGREAEALDVLRDVTRRNPGYAEAWQELAQLWLERGEVREAHQALLEAERLDPGNARVREQLAHVEGMLRVAQRGRAEAEAAVLRLLGKEAWLSLNEAARLSLVAAEVTWRQSRRTEDPADFGAAVAQQARAVELGLHRRLFVPFRELLLRTSGREGLRRATAEEVDNALLPFLRFLRAPQGGLSLGPMLAVADAVLAGGVPSTALALLRRFIDEAYPNPAQVREVLADPGLRVLNATRNQGLHRTTVDWHAANRCRAFLLGEAPGQGWLTAMTRYLSPRPIEDLASRWG